MFLVESSKLFCWGKQFSDVVSLFINPNPEVYAGADKTICEGEEVLIGDATIGGDVPADEIRY